MLSVVVAVITVFNWFLMLDVGISPSWSICKMPLRWLLRLFVWLDFHLNVKRLFAWRVCRHCSHPSMKTKGNYKYLCAEFDTCRCMYHGPCDIAVRPWVN